jgi:hypothetical protein
MEEPMPTQAEKELARARPVLNRATDLALTPAGYNVTEKLRAYDAAREAAQKAQEAERE